MMLSTLWTQLLVAQAAPAGGAGPLDGVVSLVPLLLMFAVIYLLLIRPANKQRREHQDFLGALKKDDEIVTSGGFWGRVVSLDERHVQLEIADKVRVRVLRDRISGRWNTPADAK